MRIASRYRPFSHEEGSSALIPGSSVFVTAYPSTLIVYAGDTVYQLRWALQGIIRQFTLMQDLENHAVIVSGFSQEGFFRYLVMIQDHKLFVKVDRCPKEGLSCCLQENMQGNTTTKRLLAKEQICLREAVESKPASFCLERISFGIAKSQDWQMIRRRQQPEEYLPFWFSLGQTLPGFATTLQQKHSERSSLTLVEEALDAVEKNAKQSSLDKLHEVFLAAFHSMLVPSRYDCHFQGVSIHAERFDPSHVTLSLLYKGYECIRKLLLSVKDNTIHVLTELPPIFHTGRAMNFSIAGALVDFEWSKKQLKKLTLTVLEPQTFLFSFQKDLKTFRLKEKSEKKGVCVSCSEALVLEPGLYTLDQFKK